MGILTGKKSTALSNPHLCRNCTWGQFMTGYRDAERLAVCKNTSPSMVIPFTMLECSSFSDRNRPDFTPAETPPAGAGPGGLTRRQADFTLRPARKARDWDGEDEVISQREHVH